MRIISGKFKGRSIKFLKTGSTRPLKDSVKENIFNILIHSKDFDIPIKNASILDIYSGIGSFGLECLSREAKEVTFVEENIIVSEVLKKNLESLGLINQAFVFNKKIQDLDKNDYKKKYDIFFFDPPFVDKKFSNNLRTIKEIKIFKTKHIVIIHREKNSKDDLSNILKSLKVKKYGRSKIIFGTFM